MTLIELSEPADEDLCPSLTPSLNEIPASLARSIANAAAGRVVDGAAVIAGIKAKLASPGQNDKDGEPHQ